MITFTFYLLNPEKQESLVMLALRNNGARVTVSTGVKVLTSFWDKKVQCTTKSSSDYSFISEKLSGIRTILLKEIRSGELDNLSLQQVRENTLFALGKIEEKKTQNGIVYFYRYWATTNINQHTATRQNLQQFRVFNEFIKSKDIEELPFENVDHNLYTEFTSFLLNIKTYKVNTISGHIKSLKAVMSEACKQKLHSSTDYKNFFRPQEDVDNIYLSGEELDRLYNLPLPGIKAAVRDLFLVGCYTAMRFSDYFRLTILDVVGDILKQQQQKTGTVVSIPIHPRVKEIITKWNGAPKISQQKFNNYIKTICHDAGIREKIAVTENGVTRYEEKCELVSSHTARRTAATNMFLSGIPAIAIMKITGHKTESSFMKYIKITNEENARNLAKTDFFSGHDKNSEIIDYVKTVLISGRNPKWLQLLKEAIG